MGPATRLQKHSVRRRSDPVRRLFRHRSTCVQHAFGRRFPPLIHPCFERFQRLAVEFGEKQVAVWLKRRPARRPKAQAAEPKASIGRMRIQPSVGSGPGAKTASAPFLCLIETMVKVFTSSCRI